jgi:hypothetical protein
MISELAINTSDKRMDLISYIRQQILTALILFFYTASSFSQSSDKIAVIASKSKYGEELYVRTDRDIYTAGEEVYMKIFCFSRLTHSNSGISSVAYVCLLDNLNNPILQVKIHITSLSGSGYFTLPDSLSTGNYYIATCTQWMQNFSPELYSYKSIGVINPFRNIDRIRVPSRDPEVDTVIFWPESGNIIKGAENVIGFRCLGENMDPVEIKGVITDSSNHIICHFQSDDNGFGLFRINPAVNSRLYFKPSDENLTSVSFELPSANDSGVALSITEEREQGIFRVRVARSQDFNTHDRNFLLVYAPVFMVPLVLDTDLFTDREITLNRNSLPAGLASIIVTDDTGRRYAERWVYNNKQQPMKFTVKLDKQYYSAREKVKIDITSTNYWGIPIVSNLLVSAVRLYTLPETENFTEADLQIPGLPARNNLPGIHGINDQLIFMRTAEDLTALFADRQTPVYLPEPDGHIISGVIRNTVSGEPLRKEIIVLSFVGKTALCRFTKTDTDGKFMFVSLEEGVREIVIQPLSPDLDEYYVELNNPFPEAFSKSYPLAFSLDTGMLGMLNSSIISMQVKRIYDPSMPRKSMALNRTHINDFYGLPQYTTQMSDFIQLTSLREAIKEIIPGVITNNRKGETVINTIYKYNNSIETREPLVIIDGVPVFNHEKVLNIKADKIEKIDVLNMEYYVSDIVLGGIIGITTYNGDLSVIEFDKPVFRQEFEAPRSGSGFRSPDYSDISQKESRIPDFRNTLYWNPDVRTDENGKVAVEFYTSDEPGDYIMLVEGFTSDGSRGATTLRFSVKGNKEAGENQNILK